jgi:hypothetical protein
LIAAINAEGLCLDWDESLFDAATANHLLALAKDGEQPGILKLVGHEVAGGTLDILEAFLVERGIAFDRWTEGKYEYEPHAVYFRPGMKEPVLCLTTHGQEPVVSISALKPVQAALEQSLPQRALELLREALGPDIPPLEPLEIVAGGGDGAWPRPDVELRTSQGHQGCEPDRGEVHHDHGQETGDRAWPAKDLSEAHKILAEFVRDINETGGVIRDCKGWHAPAIDLEWIDLGETYLKACDALGLKPKIASNEEDKDHGQAI